MSNFQHDLAIERSAIIVISMVFDSIEGFDGVGVVENPH